MVYHNYTFTVDKSKRVLLDGRFIGKNALCDLLSKGYNHQITSSITGKTESFTVEEICGGFIAQPLFGPSLELSSYALQLIGLMKHYGGRYYLRMDNRYEDEKE